MEDAEWRMQNGGCRMEDAEWRMQNGGCRMEDAEWRAAGQLKAEAQRRRGIGAILDPSAIIERVAKAVSSVWEQPGGLHRKCAKNAKLRAMRRVYGRITTIA
jgi:hypothetical protein